MMKRPWLLPAVVLVLALVLSACGLMHTGTPEKSGTPAASDKLELQSATVVTGKWDQLRDIPVGLLDLSGGETPVNITPAGSGPVRFYRIVKP